MACAGPADRVLCPNPATALLEVLVHAGIEVEDIPVTFRYMEIEAPDSVAIETADSNALGPAWQTTLLKQRANTAPAGCALGARPCFRAVGDRAGYVEHSG